MTSMLAVQQLHPISIAFLPNEPVESGCQNLEAALQGNDLPQAIRLMTPTSGVVARSPVTGDLGVTAPVRDPNLLAAAAASEPAPALPIGATSRLSLNDGLGSPPARPASPDAGEQKASAASYSTDRYWNDRYAERNTHFDWFFTYSALQGLIQSSCLMQGLPMLHVGCGNSGLSEGMARDGFEVVNVDISPVVIAQMRPQHPTLRQRWEVADCRDMPQYAAHTFGTVLDKGTMDAVMCCSTGQADAAAYVEEVHRTLAPGGTFLLISLGQPAARLPMLRSYAWPCTYPGGPYCRPRLPSSTDEAPAGSSSTSGSSASSSASSSSGRSKSASSLSEQVNSPWTWESIEVYLLPKPSLYLASEASLTGRVLVHHSPAHDKDEPVQWLGPFVANELAGAVEEQGLVLQEYFFAYACKKKGGCKPANEGASVQSDEQELAGEELGAAEGPRLAEAGPGTAVQ